jgi:hypothetical protein
MKPLWRSSELIRGSSGRRREEAECILIQAASAESEALVSRRLRGANCCGVRVTSVEWSFDKIGNNCSNVWEIASWAVRTRAVEAIAN